MKPGANWLSATNKPNQIAPRAIARICGLSTLVAYVTKLGGGDLEDHRVALAAAGADRGDAEPAAAAAQLVDQRAEDAGARGPDRVAERDRPAVHVDLRLVDADHAHRVECHRGERLVDLEQVDVVDRQAGLVERGLCRVRG